MNRSYTAPDHDRFQVEVRKVTEAIALLLIEKNRQYGDSALNPVRIFSRADTSEQMRVRLDDKLSRLQSGQPDEMEDVVLDLMGYLVLLRVQQAREKEAKRIEYVPGS